MYSHNLQGIILAYVVGYTIQFTDLSNCDLPHFEPATSFVFLLFMSVRDHRKGYKEVFLGSPVFLLGSELAFYSKKEVDHGQIDIIS